MVGQSNPGWALNVSFLFGIFCEGCWVLLVWVVGGGKGIGLRSLFQTVIERGSGLTRYIYIYTR